MNDNQHKHPLNLDYKTNINKNPGGNLIMASKVNPTPPLYGKDAERFFEQLNTHQQKKI